MNQWLVIKSVIGHKISFEIAGHSVVTLEERLEVSQDTKVFKTIHYSLGDSLDTVGQLMVTSRQRLEVSQEADLFEPVELQLEDGFQMARNWYL